MPTIRKFEDIQAWQNAIALADAIYAETRRPAFAKDYGLADQMRRAAVSISSNIAEGFERESNQEFVRFLSIAKGSAGELRSQLYVARNAGYLDDGRFRDLYDLASESGRILSHFISYLKKDIATLSPRRTPHTSPTPPQPATNAREAGLERGNAASNGGASRLERGQSPLPTPAQPASNREPM